MKKAVAAAMMTLAMGGAFAGDAVIVGLGAIDSSCGDWLKARREDSRIYQLSAVSWVQGFLSGMNLGRKEGEAINLPASSVIEVLLDKECASEPTEPLLASSLLIYGKLQIQQGKQPRLSK